MKPKSTHNWKKSKQTGKSRKDIQKNPPRTPAVPIRPITGGRDECVNPVDIPPQSIVWAFGSYLDSNGNQLTEPSQYCINQVYETDSWCCNNQWDSVCDFYYDECFEEQPFNYIGNCDVYPFQDESCPQQCLNQFQEQLQIGDADEDGYINIVDVVYQVQYILDNEYNPDFTPCQLWAMDVNQDGFINIQDILQNINTILPQPDENYQTEWGCTHPRALNYYPDAIADCHERYCRCEDIENQIDCENEPRCNYQPDNPTGYCYTPSNLPYPDTGTNCHPNHHIDTFDCCEFPQLPLNNITNPLCTGELQPCMYLEFGCNEDWAACHSEDTCTNGWYSGFSGQGGFYCEDVTTEYYNTALSFGLQSGCPYGCTDTGVGTDTGGIEPGEGGEEYTQDCYQLGIGAYCGDHNFNEQTHICGCDYKCVDSSIIDSGYCEQSLNCPEFYFHCGNCCSLSILPEIPSDFEASPLAGQWCYDDYMGESTFSQGNQASRNRDGFCVDCNQAFGITFDEESGKPIQRENMSSELRLSGGNTGWKGIDFPQTIKNTLKNSFDMEEYNFSTDPPLNFNLNIPTPCDTDINTLIGCETTCVEPYQWDDNLYWFENYWNQYSWEESHISNCKGWFSTVANCEYGNRCNAFTGYNPASELAGDWPEGYQYGVQDWVPANPAHYGPGKYQGDSSYPNVHFLEQWDTDLKRMTLHTETSGSLISEFEGGVRTNEEIKGVVLHSTQFPYDPNGQGPYLEGMYVDLVQAPRTSGTSWDGYTGNGVNATAHYYVGADGRIAQLACEHFKLDHTTGYHLSQFPETSGNNASYIGIEHVMYHGPSGTKYGECTSQNQICGDYNDPCECTKMNPLQTIRDGYKDRYWGSAALVADISQRWDFDLDRRYILGHWERRSGPDHTPEGEVSGSGSARKVDPTACDVGPHIEDGQSHAVYNFTNPNSNPLSPNDVLNNIGSIGAPNDWDYFIREPNHCWDWRYYMCMAAGLNLININGQFNNPYGEIINETSGLHDYCVEGVEDNHVTNFTTTPLGELSEGEVGITRHCTYGDLIYHTSCQGRCPSGTVEDCSGNCLKATYHMEDGVSYEPAFAGHANFHGYGAENGIFVEYSSGDFDNSCLSSEEPPEQNGGPCNDRRSVNRDYLPGEVCDCSDPGDPGFVDCDGNCYSSRLYLNGGDIEIYQYGIGDENLCTGTGNFDPDSFTILPNFMCREWGYSCGDCNFANNVHNWYELEIPDSIGPSPSSVLGPWTFDDTPYLETSLCLDPHTINACGPNGLHWVGNNIDYDGTPWFRDNCIKPTELMNQNLNYVPSTWPCDTSDSYDMWGNILSTTNQFRCPIDLSNKKITCQTCNNYDDDRNCIDWVAGIYDDTGYCVSIRHLETIYSRRWGDSHTENTGPNDEYYLEDPNWGRWGMWYGTVSYNDDNHDCDTPSDCFDVASGGPPHSVHGVDMYEDFDFEELITYNSVHYYGWIYRMHHYFNNSEAYNTPTSAGYTNNEFAYYSVNNFYNGDIHYPHFNNGSLNNLWLGNYYFGWWTDCSAWDNETTCPFPSFSGFYSN